MYVYDGGWRSLFFLLRLTDRFFDLVAGWCWYDKQRRWGIWSLDRERVQRRRSTIEECCQHWNGAYASLLAQGSVYFVSYRNIRLRLYIDSNAASPSTDFLLSASFHSYIPQLLFAIQSGTVKSVYFRRIMSCRILQTIVTTWRMLFRRGLKAPQAYIPPIT